MKLENTQIKPQKAKVRTLVVTGMLTAVAYVLMLFEFNVPLMPGFIKLDFSDLPELIAAFSLGPTSGAAVCLLKNILHLFISSSFGIGELSNFIIGCAFVVPAGLIYQYRKSVRGAIVASLVGIATMAVICVVSNYLLVYPLYSTVLNFSAEAILDMYQMVLPSVDNLLSALIIFNLPFTFLKGLANSLITFGIYKRISPIINQP